MRVFDENNHEVFEHPLINAIDQINDTLSDKDEKERLSIFENMMYIEPLKYLHEVGNTTYIVRTHFSENGTGKVYDTVSRLMEKKAQ